MPDETSPAAIPSKFPTIAPAWHTVVVLAVLAAISSLSAYSQTLVPVGGPRSRVPTYAGAIIWEWVMVAFIWVGLRLRHVRMRDIIGGRWLRWYSVFRDIGLAVLFLFLSNVVLGLIGQLLKAKPNSALRNIFPHGHLELTLYLLLTVTAGFCEEIIFRGYLQKQFAALTKSAGVALVLQGIAFGASHGYQGWKYMLIIAVYGCFFGLLAHYARSLRPGMIAHFLQDSVLGLAARHFMR
jgi:CAAX protease family protein